MIDQASKNMSPLKEAKMKAGLQVALVGANNCHNRGLYAKYKAETV